MISELLLFWIRNRLGVDQLRPQGLLAFQYGGGSGEDVFFRAAAILKSEKTLGTRLGSGQDALSLFQRHNLVPRIVTFLGTGNLSDSIMCQMTVSTLSRFFYLSFFAGAWRKTACVIIIGNAVTRCFAATTLELASAYH